MAEVGYPKWERAKAPSIESNEDELWKFQCRAVNYSVVSNFSIPHNYLLRAASMWLMTGRPTQTQPNEWNQCHFLRLKHTHMKAKNKVELFLFFRLSFSCSFSHVSISHLSLALQLRLSYFCRLPLTVRCSHLFIGSSFRSERYKWKRWIKCLSVHCCLVLILPISSSFCNHIRYELSGSWIGSAFTNARENCA